MFVGTGAVKEGCVEVGSKNQGPGNPGILTKGKMLGGNLGNWGRPSCGWEAGDWGGQGAEYSMTSDPLQEQQSCFGGEFGGSL